MEKESLQKEIDNLKAENSKFLKENWRDKYIVLEKQHDQLKVEHMKCAHEIDTHQSKVKQKDQQLDVTNKEHQQEIHRLQGIFISVCYAINVSIIIPHKLKLF